mgnify:CR=1 FL=1
MMFGIFARKKPCMMMRLIKDQETGWHISKIAKGSDTTFVYTSRILSKLNEKGFVTIETSGKKRLVRLTEKGKKVANAIDELMKSCEA